MTFQDAPPVSADKSHWRLWARRQVRNTTVAQWQAVAQKICSHLAQTPAFKAAERVLLYWPIANKEPDLTGLLARFPEKTWALPYAETPSGFFAARYAYNDPIEWHPTWGVYQPAGLPGVTKIVPDLVIAPALLTDAQGVRLGHGQGLYDRYLATLLKQNAAAKVLWAVSQAQLVPKLPSSHWDIAANGLVSESGLIWL
ncbi:MAG: 5-formyltetrahydrofolate cyclo-ligase [Vampirovibrionales bacterium]|nr:5-formyltetrahydrofolate cyclo-ligase [Vampirovibrionales bacterium]